MFKDFKKMNVLIFYLTIILFLVYLIIVLSASVLLTGKVLYGRPDIYYTADLLLNFLHIVIIAAYMIFILKSTTGLKREILLMFRGRSYYLKFQLLLVTIYSLLSSVLYISRFCLNSVIENRLMDIEMYSYGVAYSSVKLKYILLLFIAMILSYYFIIYIYDIFYNTSNRYSDFKTRLGHAILFICRTQAIAIACSILFTEYVYIGIEWPDPLTALVFIPMIDNYELVIIAMMSVITICIVIDYWCHFEKKVII